MEQPQLDNTLERACYRYLNGLGIVLWGDFDISQEDRKIAGAKWLARQVFGVEMEIFKEWEKTNPFPTADTTPQTEIPGVGSSEEE